MDSMPRWAKALEIPTMCCDNRIASTACSSVISSAGAWVWSSSVNKSHPSKECRPRSSSSASITSRTSRSTSYRMTRIWCSSNVRPWLVCCLDLELDTHTWTKKSHRMALAWTWQASCSTCTSPSVRAKAANPSSAMTPSRLSSSLSRARSCPYSSMCTACEGDKALCQSTSRSHCQDKGASPGKHQHRVKAHPAYRDARLEEVPGRM
jgi:hypothetical protein